MLSEIISVGLTDEQWHKLSEQMNLDEQGILEIFDVALSDIEVIKKELMHDNYADTDSLQDTRPDLFNSNGTRRADY